MKSTWQTLQLDTQNLDKLAYMYENEPSQFPQVSKREMAKRLEKIKMFKGYVEEELGRDYNDVVGAAGAVQMGGDQL